MSFFEPDILNNHAVQRRGWGAVRPERRLMVAILGDAIDCFRKNLDARSRKRRRLCLEAETWIFSDDVDWVFSFRNICDAVGVDPAALREQVEAWKRYQMARAWTGGGVRIHPQTDVTS